MFNSQNKIEVIDELDLGLARSVIKAREPFPITCFQLKKKQEETKNKSFEDEEKARYGYLSVPVLNYKELDTTNSDSIKIRSKSIDLSRTEIIELFKGKLFLKFSFLNWKKWIF